MTETKFEPFNVNARMKISALWTSVLFVFAYVDLFSLYRSDFRADLEAGEVGGLAVNQAFLLRARSANGPTTSSAAPSRSHFSRASPTTRGLGRRRLPQHQSTWSDSPATERAPRAVAASAVAAINPAAGPGTVPRRHSAAIARKSSASTAG